MTDKTATTAAPGTWWDELYADHRDTHTRPHLGGSRLPDWRKGETATLGGGDGVADETKDEPTPKERTTEGEQPQPAEQLVEEEYDDGELAEDDETDDEEAPVALARRRRWRSAREWAVAARSGQWSLTPRIICYNGTAAAAGYLLGIAPALASPLRVAQSNPAGMIGAVVTVTGGVAAWLATGSQHVAPLLPVPPLSRLLLTLGAAELARRWAPFPVAWLAQNGTPWGLGLEPAAFLITAAGMCAGLWWLTVPRTRRWWWPIRWAARIPFASALLAAAALYGPGSIH
jgi:hypothetical protein